MQEITIKNLSKWRLASLPISSRSKVTKMRELLYSQPLEVSILAASRTAAVPEPLSVTPENKKNRLSIFQI